MVLALINVLNITHKCTNVLGMCKGTKNSVGNWEQRWSILLDVMKDLFIISWQLNGAAQENGYGAMLARILHIMSNKKINTQTLDLENPCTASRY